MREDVDDVFGSWKFVDKLLTYCLWALYAWNFENRLKSHNMMTLNIKPCSNLLPLQNEDEDEAFWFWKLVDKVLVIVYKHRVLESLKIG